MSILHAVLRSDIVRRHKPRNYVPTGKARRWRPNEQCVAERYFDFSIKCMQEERGKPRGLA